MPDLDAFIQAQSLRPSLLTIDFLISAFSPRHIKEGKIAQNRCTHRPI